MRLNVVNKTIQRWFACDHFLITTIFGAERGLMLISYTFFNKIYFINKPIWMNRYSTFNLCWVTWNAIILPIYSDRAVRNIVVVSRMRSFLKFVILEYWVYKFICLVLATQRRKLPIYHWRMFLLVQIGSNTVPSYDRNFVNYIPSLWDNRPVIHRRAL